MIYYKNGDTNIVIKKSVLRVFFQYKQIGRRPEQGGILLGKVKKNKLILTRASIPTYHDRASRYSFVRNKKSGQLFANYEFLNSNGKVIYLGEWHTHPEDHPSPSRTDKAMIVKQFAKNYINEQVLLMIIVGLKSNYLALYDGAKLIELNEEITKP